MFLIVVDLLNAIGNTPLVRMQNIWVKLEYLNPSGSVKDRMIKFLLEKAEKTGELKKGFSVVEATSGNTGIALSMICAAKGYRAVVVMPKGLSAEREEMIKAFGAKVVLVHENCVKCAVEKTHSFKKKVFFPRQFENPWNVEENERVFGKEILRQVSGKIDAFVAGVGTGGTLIGVGKALRKKFPNVRLVAVEPEECPLLSLNKFGRHGITGLHKGFTCKKHGIEGIGDGFVPKIVEQSKGFIDEVVRVSTGDAVAASNALAKKGFLVGPSSGANFLAALKIKKRFKNVVTLFPDRGERYLSERVFG